MMETATGKTSVTETAADAATVDQSAFVGDERGQISVMVVLSVIPFVLLLAFIFNSAKQTTRRIEMQGAADSAAVASAVTTARGMNFMVLNNNAMAETLSLMVAVRCILNTARIMVFYIPFKTAVVCAAAAECLGLCPELDKECLELPAIALPRWLEKRSEWSGIDELINDESSGIGWRLLAVLDGLNQVVKSAFPVWSAYQARDFAQKNGADLDPVYGFVLGGKSENNLSFAGLSVPLPIPTFPVARGPEGATAYRAESCQYKWLHLLDLLCTGYVASVNEYTAVEAALVYQALRWANLNHLKGDWGTIGEIFDEVIDMLPRGIVRVLGGVAEALLRLTGVELLGWPDDPPKPMLLTDHPRQAPDATTDEREVDDETRDNLRPYLQHLGVALGRVSRGSPIGGERFLNRPNSFAQMQFTYAEADVYNPTKWDMWTQDWRAQLSRSKVFDQKINDLLQILSLPGGGLDWSFINTH